MHTYTPHSQTSLHPHASPNHPSIHASIKKYSFLKSLTTSAAHPKPAITHKTPSTSKGRVLITGDFTRRTDSGAGVRETGGLR